MANTILRAEAWKKIDSGESFDIDFVLADTRRGTGGQLRSLKNMQKVKTGKPVATSDKSPTVRTIQQKLARDPNHGAHKTVNIHCPSKPGQHIYKIHYRLFTRFNGKIVLS